MEETGQWPPALITMLRQRKMKSRECHSPAAVTASQEKKLFYFFSTSSPLRNDKIETRFGTELLCYCFIRTGLIACLNQIRGECIQRSGYQLSGALILGAWRSRPLNPQILGRGSWGRRGSWIGREILFIWAVHKVRHARWGRGPRR